MNWECLLFIFSTIELPWCDTPCPRTSCGIYGLKETDRVWWHQMSCLYHQKTYFTDNFWLDSCSRKHPLNVFFFIFYWNSFILSCILWIGLVHILCVFPFSFSNIIPKNQKKKNVNLGCTWTIMIRHCCFHFITNQSSQIMKFPT